MVVDSERKTGVEQRHALMALATILLFAPFVIRHMSPTLEPYPAILMPVGAGTTDLKHTLRTISHYTLSVVMENGTAVEVDPKVFLGPMASRHWHRLAINKLGTSATPRQALMGRIPLPPHPAATAAQRAELHTWLHQRAAEQDFGPIRELLIIRHDRSVDVATGAYSDHGTSSIDTLRLAS